ncbi:MAG: hypothetical protein CFH06_01253 [Alphaproteobacteria bacterium MarineAlpha3_Bin5]|nr:pyridoxamine 5'-phosphate oxidase [Magnetovibrio sp.]PPR77472.1 MAG: hypothetical protein CFH06_01253 [Alphaproteobacteria bacterium MarineAlpha3_Bin5]|tara:strand:- start:503 stop:1234 length:732 start_codon:yes stop_codon:yes gene_type:complete
MKDSDQARTLIRKTLFGSLATVEISPSGFPYSSLVTYGLDFDGSPIFLFSRLSVHTRNLDKDPRCSLLISSPARHRNPQTAPRVTLMGSVKKKNSESYRDRFLHRHPQACLYATFKDFSFFAMAINKAHFVGGFALSSWLKSSEILSDQKAAKNIACAEQDLIEHMNREHFSSIDLFANVLLRRAGSNWIMTGVDPDGCDLRRKDYFARLSFTEPVNSPQKCREQLMKMAAKARKKATSQNKK